MKRPTPKEVLAYCNKPKTEMEPYKREHFELETQRAAKWFLKHFKKHKNFNDAYMLMGQSYGFFVQQQVIYQLSLEIYQD